MGALARVKLTCELSLFSQPLSVCCSVRVLRARARTQRTGTQTERERERERLSCVGMLLSTVCWDWIGLHRFVRGAHLCGNARLQLAGNRQDSGAPLQIGARTARACSAQLLAVLAARL